MHEDSNQKASPYTAPILFPIDPAEYWQRIRQIIKEEVALLKSAAFNPSTSIYQTPGLQYKPLYKMSEVCSIFGVTKPTVYDWCKHGKLKPVKIRSRVYFLWQDIQLLMESYGKMEKAA